MERHYLELSEGSEHKFYEVVLDEVTLRIRYGRIGTEGQSQTKVFGSADAAAAEAHKKLAEKRRKGYADAEMGEREKRSVPVPRLKLPELLKPYRLQIEATIRPFVKLERADHPTTPWGSKLGGPPYRLPGLPWPTTADGRPLAFLAQLNLAELPALEGFPRRGIVQFFILDDDQLGQDLSTAPADVTVQHTYRVIYHPEPVQDTAHLDLQVPEQTSQYLPHVPADEYALRGSLTHGPMTLQDRLFEDTIPIDFLDETEDDDGEILGDRQFDAYHDIAPDEHKWGGHPNFTQNDPRGTEDPHILLFQLASDPALGLMWGDAGVANFLIHPDDLAKLDFSRVYYHWDCC